MLLSLSVFRLLRMIMTDQQIYVRAARQCLGEKVLCPQRLIGGEILLGHDIGLRNSFVGWNDSESFLLKLTIFLAVPKSRWLGCRSPN
jgi:hypothetical protein